MLASCDAISLRTNILLRRIRDVVAERWIDWNAIGHFLKSENFWRTKRFAVTVGVDRLCLALNWLYSTNKTSHEKWLACAGCWFVVEFINLIDYYFPAENFNKSSEKFRLEIPAKSFRILSVRETERPNRNACTKCAFLFLFLSVSVSLHRRRRFACNLLKCFEWLASSQPLATNKLLSCWPKREKKARIRFAKCRFSENLRRTMKHNINLIFHL